MSRDEDETPIQRFEDLASRLFRIAKGDVDKAKRKAEKLASDISGEPEEASPED